MSHRPAGDTRPACSPLCPGCWSVAARRERGSITGLYTVLVEGDDMNEPMADTARGLLDGHIVLSRELAEQNHFPAVDVLASVSRLFPVSTVGSTARPPGRSGT